MIIDTFLFYDELDLLELRLRELGGLVDRFIAVQGETTFAGDPKPLFLDVQAPRWRPWAGRLETIVVRAWPGAPSRWARENAARDVLVPALDDVRDPHAIILHEDADEIPDRAVVERMAPQVEGEHWVGLRPRLYYYYLNLHTGYAWSAIAMADIDAFRRMGPNYFRDNRKHPPISVKRDVGGWHFSWLGGVERALQKIGAWPHEEFDTPQYRDPVRLAERIAHLQDPFGVRSRTFHRVPLTQLPADVQARPEAYRHLLLPEEAA